jgi:glutamate 5-kinase
MVEIRKKILKDVKKIVVKVGTSILADANGSLDSSKVGHVVSQICRVADRGIDVIVVSSGAIGAGMGILGLKARPADISKKQAIAAIGQIQLMKLYDDFFKAQNKIPAQVLLTQDDFSDKKRHLNAKHTLFTILEYKGVPIINENDTTAIEEIKFGDNDKLSSLVANLVNAQLLVILSDVDGLWGENKETIGIVQRVTNDIERLARGTTKQISTGGMVTKLQAAKTATEAGAACVIANGHTENVLVKVLDGENIGTLFLPQ